MLPKVILFTTFSRTILKKLLGALSSKLYMPLFSTTAWRRAVVIGSEICGWKRFFEVAPQYLSFTNRFLDRNVCKINGCCLLLFLIRKRSTLWDGVLPECITAIDASSKKGTSDIFHAIFPSFLLAKFNGLHTKCEIFYHQKNHSMYFLGIQSLTR